LKALLENNFQTRKIGEGDLIISLPENHSWMTTPDSRHLYVRGCCVGLYNRLVQLKESGKKGAVVTGNPGIGNSWFLNYLLFKWITEKKGKVYFQSQESEKSWLFSSDTLSYQDYPDDLGAEDLYLYDPAGVPAEPIRVQAFTVIATSPDRSPYKQFFKRVGIKLYLPSGVGKRLNVFANQMLA